MGEEKYDMEVTPERAEYMKKLLVRLYAHQIGAEVESITVRPVGAKKAEAVQMKL